MSDSVIHTALDQLADLVAQADPARHDDATPCEGWTVRDLLDHVVAAPGKFARAARGDDVDWNASPRSDDPSADLRHGADALLAANADPDGQGMPEGGQAAELAVHTWDLATALGVTTADLDPAVAETGLAFMRASLTDERRGTAFGPEQAAPEGADVYQQIAAFAGRVV